MKNRFFVQLVLFCGLFIFSVGCATTLPGPPKYILSKDLPKQNAQPGEKAKIWSDAKQQMVSYTYVRVYGPCRGEPLRSTEDYRCNCRTKSIKGETYESCDTCTREIWECHPHARLKCEPEHQDCYDGRIDMNTIEAGCCHCEFNVATQDKYGVTQYKDQGCEREIDDMILIRDE